ncbi:hypothetical protein HanIR_Chr02g0093361 [Helianthus annuus]|nr:hypothetical protein HanIR_Chr02g0093361 [Helianthus annuus]
MITIQNINNSVNINNLINQTRIVYTVCCKTRYNQIYYNNTKHNQFYKKIKHQQQKPKNLTNSL